MLPAIICLSITNLIMLALNIVASFVIVYYQTKAEELTSKLKAKTTLDKVFDMKRAERILREEQERLQK